MTKGRVEAFSDGVFAILITILVLELKVPRGADWQALHPMLPVFLAYVLSFVYLGIYWSNHHHMFHLVQRIDGRIMWANLHLLFWLSLIPFATGWMGSNHAAPMPTAIYGVILLVSGLAYLALQRLLIARQGPGSKLAAALRRDVKGPVSPVLYAIAIGLAFVHTWMSHVLYIDLAGTRSSDRVAPWT
jgi:uncharacterized membrane protein